MTGNIFRRLDLDTGRIDGAPLQRRLLGDLHGVFADQRVFARTLQNGNPLIYTVSTYEGREGDGQLHCGLGVLYPGRIGDEYYLTRGHLHAWRPAAELYIGLRGTGKMILEPEHEETWQVFDLLPDSFVYVPGGTAHRTVNVGPDPLVYLGVYPSAAGHDYTSLEHGNFRALIVDRDGVPTAIERAEYLRKLESRF